MFLDTFTKYMGPPTIVSTIECGVVNNGQSLSNMCLYGVCSLMLTRLKCRCPIKNCNQITLAYLSPFCNRRNQFVVHCKVRSELVLIVENANTGVHTRAVEWALWSRCLCGWEHTVLHSILIPHCDGVNKYLLLHGWVTSRD